MVFVKNLFKQLKNLAYATVFFYENRFITDFKEKAEHFNTFFSNQCFLLKNYSKLLISLRYITDKRIGHVKLIFCFA